MLKFRHPLIDKVFVIEKAHKNIETRNMEALLSGSVILLGPEVSCDFRSVVNGNSSLPELHVPKMIAI